MAHPSNPSRFGGFSGLWGGRLPRLQFGDSKDDAMADAYLESGVPVRHVPGLYSAEHPLDCPE